MAKRVHVYISGLVQGVGYRYATTRAAANLGLAGWVRNLPDGRVEAEFQGPEPILQKMLVWCRQGPILAKVREVQESWMAPLKDCTRFEVHF